MPHLSDRAYKTAKYLVQIGLPAVATAYFAIAQIWGASNPEEVVATITAVNTALGVLLGINNRVYNTSGAKYDGSISVEETDNKKVFTIDTDADELEKKSEVLLKINNS